MPFENLKRQLDFQKQAQDAERKHQQWIEEQKYQASLSQERIRLQQALDREGLFKECFTSSHIEQTSQQLITVLPDLRIILSDKERVIVPNGGKITNFLERLGNGGKKYSDLETDMHSCLTLRWDFQEKEEHRRPYESWSYINTGFLEDKTLVVKGNSQTFLTEQQWRGNHNLIEEAMEKAILNPRQGDNRPEPSTDTSW
jgi:hypothetical protein